VHFVSLLDLRIPLFGPVLQHLSILFLDARPTTSREQFVVVRYPV
jgi:hypothetical protein